MRKSKLLEIIGALDEHEMRRLHSFLRSPYFHQVDVPEDELKLFDLLDKHHPDFTSDDLKKDMTFKQLYPKKPYVKGKIDKKMSSLLKRVEQFISQEERNQPNQAFYQLLDRSRFYRKKNLSRLYQISLSTLRKKQDDIQKKDRDDLFHEFLIQKEIAEYQSLHNTRKKDLNLINVLKSLDDFYLLSKLEYSCGLLFQREFHSQVELSDSLLILKKVGSELSTGNFTSVPLTKVFFQFFTILQKMEGEEENYFDDYQGLEHLLQKYEAQLPLDSLKTFHAFCRSFYTRQFNHGKLFLEDKIFELYNEHLKKGYLFQAGGLTPSIFKNVVFIGLKLKKYDWVNSFLQDYKDSIVGTKFPQDIYNFNLASYYFQLQKYELAKDCLVDFYDDLYYQLSAKRLEIKICFEEKSVLLESKIEAFRLFLRRLSKKKPSGKTLQGNNNFINFIKQLLLPKTYKNPKRISSLRTKINGMLIIKEKEWLLEKLE